MLALTFVVLVWLPNMCAASVHVVHGFDIDDPCFDAPLPCPSCPIKMTSRFHTMGKLAYCNETHTPAHLVVAPCQQPDVCGVLHIDSSTASGRRVMETIMFITKRVSKRVMLRPPPPTPVHRLDWIFRPSVGREEQAAKWDAACLKSKTCSSARLCALATLPFSRAGSLQACVSRARANHTVLILDVDIVPTENALAVVSASLDAAGAVYVAGRNFYSAGMVATRISNIVRAGGFMPKVYRHHGCEDTSLAARLAATGTMAVKVYTELSHAAHSRTTSFYEHSMAHLCYFEKAAWLRTTQDPRFGRLQKTVLKQGWNTGTDTGTYTGTGAGTGTGTGTGTGAGAGSTWAGNLSSRRHAAADATVKAEAERKEKATASSGTENTVVLRTTLLSSLQAGGHAVVIREGGEPVVTARADAKRP